MWASHRPCYEPIHIPRSGPIDVSNEVLPVHARPADISYRPKVLLNQRTGRFVLWANYLPPDTIPLAAYTKALYLVATSPYPHGVFNVVTTAASVAHSGAGDLTLFADVGGACYVAYDSWSTEHTLAMKYRLCLPATAYATSHLVSAAISATRQVVQLSFTRITSARTLVHFGRRRGPEP